MKEFTCDVAVMDAAVVWMSVVLPNAFKTLETHRNDATMLIKTQRRGAGLRHRSANDIRATKSCHTCMSTM